MATNPAQLATEMANGINQTIPTVAVQAWAIGVLQDLTLNGSATFGNMQSGHPISGLSGAAMAGFIIAASAGFYPNVSTQLLNFCTAVANHITSNGTVEYSGPPPAPPAVPPSAAWFTGGTVSGLDGSAMATEVAASVGYPSVTPELIGFCTAIADHINNNAQVESGVIS